MQRAFLPAVLGAALYVVGAASVFSQTALELVERAQKDLQTRFEARRAKPDDPVAPRPEQDRQEDYLWQASLGALRQARQDLLTGNEESALQILSQLPNVSGTSNASLADTDAIVQKLQADRAAREAAFVGAVEAACKQAGVAVLAAKEPKDLDATLQALDQLNDKSANRYNDSGSSRAVSRLQAAITFVNRWQDYLLARSRNNESGVANALRNLADSGNQAPLVPRSQILALLPATDTENESSGRSRHPARPQGQIDAEAVEIVQEVKKLADVPAALAKLTTLRKEITSQSSYNLSSESELGAALTSLQALQKTAVELQNGVATNLSLGSGRLDANAHAGIENALLPVRIELVKLAAPRLLGASEDEKAAEGEALDNYLRRLIESAKHRQDWDAVVRGLELKHALAAASTSPYVVSNDQEVAAYKSFFAGRNLEQAGQYEQAVISYLTALRSGQEDLPSTVIGESLEAIQKAHPADYTAGASYVLNPPPSSYGPFGESSRFGPNGGMYRGGYDPRFPGRPGMPGMPGTPVDDRLPVPAAPPSPVPAPPKPATPSAAPSASPVPSP